MGGSTLITNELFVLCSCVNRKAYKCQASGSASILERSLNFSALCIFIEILLQAWKISDEKPKFSVLVRIRNCMDLADSNLLCSMGDADDDDVAVASNSAISLSSLFRSHLLHFSTTSLFEAVSVTFFNNNTT